MLTRYQCATLVRAQGVTIKSYSVYKQCVSGDDATFSVSVVVRTCLQIYIYICMYAYVCTFVFTPVCALMLIWGVQMCEWSSEPMRHWICVWPFIKSRPPKTRGGNTMTSMWPEFDLPFFSTCDFGFFVALVKHRGKERSENIYIHTGTGLPH